MLARFGAEIIWNLRSESRKRHFWRPKIQKFSGGAFPRRPLVEIDNQSGKQYTLGTPLYKKAGYAPGQ